MGPWERQPRRTINPISTGLTGWWLGGGRRQVPLRSTTTNNPPRPGNPHPRVFTGTPSPGDWVVPPGMRPAWEWLPPEHGAMPNLRAMPRWVRVWYRVPLIDRYAYEWMWWRGGWSVFVPGDTPPPPDAGDREPRRPRPNAPAGLAQATTEQRA